MHQPTDRVDVGVSMFTADGAGHENHSINEFGPDAGRHRLVATVKLNLVEPLSSDERRLGGGLAGLGRAHRSRTSFRKRADLPAH